MICEVEERGRGEDSQGWHEGFAGGEEVCPLALQEGGRGFEEPGDGEDGDCDGGAGEEGGGGQAEGLGQADAGGEERVLGLYV